LSPPKATIGLTFIEWFRDRVQRRGFINAVAESAGLLWQFFRESLHDRRRQRYGDVDYDWDHRVDTTSATISARNRLLGLLHSPYQPSDPVLFHEIMAKLDIDFRKFVFVDIGSGKGRVLLMAADYPFRRIIGIELLPELHRIAQENVRKYKNESQQCFKIETICHDAANFVFPPDPLVLYLFNPLPELGLAALIANLDRSLEENPRRVYVLYHNPTLERVVRSSGWLRKASGTHQYSTFVAELGGNPQSR
jgi:SAM-dependent methyltransferase